MFYRTQQQKERIRKQLLGVTRKIVLVIGTACFISMATGVTLQLHLLSCAHPDKHDHDNCPICANLLIHSNKFLQYPEIQVIYYDYFVSGTVHPAHASIPKNYLTAFNPRPPPLAS